MKTLTTLALLTALVVGTSANAGEYGQDVAYYNGAVMCGTGCGTCAPSCRPACADCCAPTYHQKCYWDSCSCTYKSTCCRDVKGIFDGMRW